MQDMLAGQIDLLINSPIQSLPQARAGKIKTYAVLAKDRYPSAPDIPTTDDAGLPEFHMTVWNALWAVKGTPKDIVGKLNAAAVEALADPAVQKRFAELGQNDAAARAADAGSARRAATSRYREVVAGGQGSQHQGRVVGRGRQKTRASVWGGCRESSSQKFPAPCGRRRRSAARHAARVRASLSVAAGAHHRRLSAGQRRRRRLAPDQSVAVGAARPAVRRREPAGRRLEHRDRGGRARAPDGYTLLWVGPPVAINATLYDKLNFIFLRDIAPVAGINREPNVMLVNPSFEAKTVPAFIAYAKANPGKISMASVGNGSVSHVAGELFKMMAGVDMVHVPYRGSGPALTDLIGGRVQVLFTTTSASMPYIKSGQVRALGVGTATKVAALPDLPLVSEFVPGFEASNFYGVGAPRDTPVESSTGSTRRSAPSWPNPRSGRGWPISAPRRCRSRPPISASSSPTKPRSGPRW